MGKEGLCSSAPHPLRAFPQACEQSLAKRQMSGISSAGMLRTTSVSGVHLRKK